MATRPECLGQDLFILLLRGPDIVFHGLKDVVVIPGFDHEIAYTWKNGASDSLREHINTLERQVMGNERLRRLLFPPTILHLLVVACYRVLLQRHDATPEVPYLYKADHTSHLKPAA